jgi:hypothetical protein
MGKNFRGYHKFPKTLVSLTLHSHITGRSAAEVCIASFVVARVNYTTAGKILLAFKRRQGSNEGRHSSP